MEGGRVRGAIQNQIPFGCFMAMSLMIIIGSFTSANSKRLTELALQRNKKTYQVTGKADLKKEWFINIENVGISAGASTPDYLIDEVKEQIKIFEKELK